MSTYFQLSFTSIGSIIIFSMCFAWMLAIVMRSDRILSKVKYELLLLCLVAPIMRLLLPLEVLPWTHNINVSYVLPQITVFLHKSIVVGGYTWSRWQFAWSLITLISIVALLYTIIGYVKVRHMVNGLQPADSAVINRLVDKISEEKGKKLRVAVKWSNMSQSPLVFGVIHPTILMPRVELSERELENVLRHELAHCLSGDLLIRLGWKLIKAFCWWNPAVYMIDRQLERLLEIRADENATVGRADVHRDEYMKTLVEMSKFDSVKEASIYGTAYQDKWGLSSKRRINIILNRVERGRMDSAITNLTVSSILIILTIAMNCFIFEPINRQVEPERESSTMVTEENCFLVRNAEGTYDMYYKGVFCATLESSERTRLNIYNSMEEALEHEEIP